MKIIVVLVVLGIVRAVEDAGTEIPFKGYEIFVPEIQAYNVVSTIYQVENEEKFKPKVERSYYLTHRSPKISP